jgi:uncharacterized protein YqjF (DUF2071 family)
VSLESAEAPRPGERVFLSADWRDLLMLNYSVDPALLTKHVPPGTQLDSFEGKTYVSLVGFRFLRTRLFGFLPVPFHTDFDEVNLRFYVRRRAGEKNRRGVVFVSEVVPKRAVALLARLAYGENYSRHPMRHRIEKTATKTSVEYQWRAGGEWCRLYARISGEAARPPEGSLEQFITEHYWGYAAQRSGGCADYRVAHIPWRVWSSPDAGFEGDAIAAYGAKLGPLFQRSPDSAFLAEGSPVRVFTGTRIS